MAVDMDEVDSRGIELWQERLEGCWSSGEGSRDGIGVVLHGGGGFGKGPRGTFGRFGCHPGLCLVGLGLLCCG